MLDSLPRCQIAVIGGGAAGLMAAIAAAMTRSDSADQSQSDNPVLLLEKMDRVGKKLLTTGNGRCNLTNQDLAIEHYHGSEPNFAAAVLNKFPLDSTIDFFRRLGLPCRTLENGRVYPYSLQASAVLDVLRLAAERLGVRTETNCAVSGLQPAKEQGGFVISTQDRRFWAQRVIVATGGLAAPGLGCDGSGYSLLTRLGHRRTETFPALVQIRTETELVRGLAGIKFEGTASVAVGGQIIRVASGEILFTEYGLSGPPLLELSRDVAQLLQKTAEPVAIVLDLLPEMTISALKDWLTYRRQCDPSHELTDFLTGLVHKKLGQALLKRCLDRAVSLGSPVSSLDDAEIDQLADLLKALPIRAIGTRDWTQAQVTAGGLDTHDFQSETLESRLVPGLFAAGEILDVDGDCGGYNLQWAWASGHTAGQQAMRQCLAEPKQP